MNKKSEKLTGWLKEVYKITLKLPIEFRLIDLYHYENHFSKLYPDNDHIKAKIRQTLQYLRNIGLIAFLDRGRYKRL